MADVVILRDVRDTLKTLLQENIAELSEENAIIFDSPGEIDDSTMTRLTAFLYQITENSDLRNMPPTYPEFSKKQFAPLALNLHFMFVPYAQSREMELIIIERLMQILYVNAVLKGDILQGSLQSSGNAEIQVVPHTLSLDELNKLWSTFPNKAFKLSMTYILTPVRVPPDWTEDIFRVTEKIITAASTNSTKSVV